MYVPWGSFHTPTVILQVKQLAFLPVETHSPLLEVHEVLLKGCPRTCSSRTDREVRAEPQKARHSFCACAV